MKKTPLPMLEPNKTRHPSFASSRVKWRSPQLPIPISRITADARIKVRELILTGLLFYSGAVCGDFFCGSGALRATKRLTRRGSTHFCPILFKMVIMPAANFSDLRRNSAVGLGGLWCLLADIVFLDPPVS